MAKKKVQKPQAREPGPDDLEAFRDTAHLPDRDQLFDTGAREQPPRPVEEFFESWTGDIEQRTKGTRDMASDAVRDLEEKAPNLTGPEPEASTIDELRIAGRQETIGGATLNLGKLSDAELRRRAESLGIPGRRARNRIQLIEAIREALDAPTMHV